MILREKLRVKFEIGVYDSDSLIKTILPYYEKSYLNETYRLIDKDNLLYKNGDSIYKLSLAKFNYSPGDIPDKLFSFYKARLNEERTLHSKG